MRIQFEGRGLERARPRDWRRFLLYARAAEIMGHEVELVPPGAVLAGSYDIKFLCSVTIKEFSRTFSDRGKPVVVVAGSKREASTMAEMRFAGHGVIYAATRWTQQAADQLDLKRKLVRLAHLPSERFLDYLEERSLMEAYAQDDLETIRAELRSGQSGPEHLIGFVGNSTYGRKALGQAMPKWAKIHWTTDWPIEQYVRFMLSCQVCLDLPGQRAKCHRFIEAVLLGRPVAFVKEPPEQDPPINRHNAILMNGPEDLEALSLSFTRSDTIVQRADECYLDGWSPAGQLHTILRRAMELA